MQPTLTSSDKQMLCQCCKQTGKETYEMTPIVIPVTQTTQFDAILIQLSLVHTNPPSVQQGLLT